MSDGTRSTPERGGHWGLRYCGIGQFFMRYFGNFNLELRYCGILQTCGMRFLDVLVDDIRYKNVSFTFFRPFIAVFGRFGSTLKRPYFVTHFNLQFDCFNNPFKAVSLFSRSHRSFCLYNPPAIQVYYKTAVFSDLFCGIAVFVEFFCGNAVFSNPQCPPPEMPQKSKVL